MLYDTLNLALESENIEMDIIEVGQKIGSINKEETKRFQTQSKQVSIYRNHNGRYEILSYAL